MAIPPPPMEPPQPAQTPPAYALPWEDTSQPFLEALFETIKLFVVNPTAAFGRMRTSGDLGRPILYAVMLGWVGVIVSQLYSLALRGMAWKAMPGMGGMGEMALPFGMTIIMMIFAPVLVLIGVFIWSGIVHLMLLILGSANEGFDATVRVMCYATTAQLAQVVPLCGGLAGGVWAIVLEIIGIAQAHRITQGKAALAVLLPVVFCCACMALVFAFSGAAIIAAITGAASQAR